MQISRGLQVSVLPGMADNSVMRHKTHWYECSELLMADGGLVASIVMVAAAWAATCHLKHMLLRVAALRQLNLCKPYVHFLQ